MQSLVSMALVTGLALLPVAGPGPEIGQPAPAFKLMDAQGKTHALADYKGKFVVIEWVNITCPSAQFNYENSVIPRLQKEYLGQDKNVVWLSMIITQRQQDEYGKNRISPERAKSMAGDMVTKYGAAPTATLIDVDGKVAAQYDTKTSMHMFVVNREGVLVYDGAINQLSSLAEGSKERVRHVANALDEAMAGKPVTTSKTKPYGCHEVLAK